MKILVRMITLAIAFGSSALVSAQATKLIEPHKLSRIAESNNVWIYSDKADIALDFINYPRYVHLPLEDRVRFYSSLNARIRELLSEDDQKFMFIETNFGHSGYRQTCGIVFLGDGTTLQEVLIREGFARFDRNWKQSGKGTQSDGAVARIEALEKKLLAADNDAKKNFRGYWKIDGYSMKYYWDEELEGERFQAPKKKPNKAEMATPRKPSD